MERRDIPKHKRSLIKHHVIAEDDNSYEAIAGSIFFQNQGTSRVVIDDHLVLDPLDTFQDADFEGGTIIHEYKIEFIDLATPRADDNPRLFSGNRLYIRQIRRKTYKRCQDHSYP